MAMVKSKDLFDDCSKYHITEPIEFKPQMLCTPVCTPDLDAVSLEDVQDIVVALNFLLDGRNDELKCEILDEALHRFGFWGWYKKKYGRKI